MRICTACSKENPDYLNSCLDCGKNINPASRKSLVKIYIVSLVMTGAAIACVVVKKPSFLFPEENASANPTLPEPAAESLSPTKLSPPETNAEAPAPTHAKTVKSVAPAIVQTSKSQRIFSGSVIESATPLNEDSAKSGPKPRKRVQHQTLDTADILAGTSPTSLKVKGDNAGIKSASEAYMRMLQHVIVKEYLEGLAKQGIPDEQNERSKITILVNSRSNEIELLNTPASFDPQKKEILRKVISGCSERILCPKELNEDMGDLVKLDFPLVTKS